MRRMFFCLVCVSLCVAWKEQRGPRAWVLFVFLLCPVCFYSKNDPTLIPSDFSSKMRVQWYHTGEIHTSVTGSRSAKARRNKRPRVIFRADPVLCNCLQCHTAVIVVIIVVVVVVVAAAAAVAAVVASVAVVAAYISSCSSGTIGNSLTSQLL